MGDKHYYVTRKTETHEYILHFDLKQSRNGYYTTSHMYVGDPKNPCLSLSVPLTDSLKNNRFDTNDLSIAHLNNIKSLKECILSGEEHAFAKELLQDVMYIIKQNYTHIHHIKLTDSSFIPCGVDDTLDLLYYSVAIYGKTWYEYTFNAYFVPREAFIDYKCKVNDYSKPETKLPWTTFIKAVYSKMNEFAKNVMTENTDYIEEIYVKSPSYPLFFQALSKFIKKEDKCTFFKGWLGQFVESFVVVPRNWYIDLYTVSTHMRRGGSGSRRLTRRKTK